MICSCHTAGFGGALDRTGLAGKQGLLCAEVPRVPEIEFNFKLFRQGGLLLREGH